MKGIFIFTALTALTACTAEPMSENPQAQFHMPFTYKDWTAKREGGACVVTTGYRGLVVETFASGLRVASVNDIIPGERLTLTVNNHRYTTSDTAFDAADSQAIVKDFTTGDKAYLRITRRSGFGHGFSYSDNILKLDGFAKAYRQCETPMKKSSKKK